MNLKGVVEGILFVVGDDGVTLKELHDILGVDVEEINEKDLNHEIDDSVFEEIDHISDIDEVETDEIKEDESIEEEETSSKELSIKDELDNIIASGQDLENHEMDYELDEDIPDVDGLIDKDIDFNGIEAKEEKNDAGVEKQETDEEDTILDDNLFNEEKETSYKLEEDDNTDNTINLFIPDYLTEEPVKEDGVESLFNPEEFKDVEESENALNSMNSSIFDSNDDFDSSILDLGLDKFRFSEEDVNKLEKNFNKENTSKFLNIMEKHGLDKTLIYTSVDTLLEVTPQNLDHILTLLEHTNATSDDISYVFNMLNKVNINKLEEVVERAKEDELANLLFASMDYSNNCELMIKLGFTKDDIGSEKLQKAIAKLNRKEFIKQFNVGEYTFNDILDAFVAPLRDPRDKFDKPILRSDVLHLEDLAPGMELQGTVRNVVDFGAFVDCGVKEDGLVHTSRMSKKYIKHPSEVVSVGDIIKVWVVNVDLKRGRVELSMVNPAQ